MSARVLRRVAVGLVAGWGVLGILFVDGELLDDPGGWMAAGLVAACDLPLIALAWLALDRPAAAARVLPAVLAVVGGLVVVDAFGGLVDRDRWGPVDTVALLVVAVPCGLLGLHRAGRAGLLLLAAAAVTLVSTLARFDRAGGQTVRSALGGSSGVQLVPFLLLGLLFLAAWTLERAGHRPAHPAITTRERPRAPGPRGSAHRG